MQMNYTLTMKFTLILGLGFALFAVPAAQARQITQLSLASIDQQLAKSEAQYADIVANTEKTILWHNGIRRSALSLVYLHGFSASRQEISPVTENLATQLGANAYFTRLRGHARSDDALAEATVADWFEDAREAYEIGALIGEKVIIVSTSTGGTLATWLVAQPFANRVIANIMVSPNYGPRDRFAEIIRWDWGLLLATWLTGDYHSFEPLNPEHALYWTERYPLEAAVPMIELVDIVLEMDKSSITTPHMIIYSPRDQVVSTERIETVIKQLSASNVVVEKFESSSDPAQHVLGGDAVAPESTDTLIQLIADYIAKLPAALAIIEQN